MVEPQSLKLGAWLLAAVALAIGTSFLVGFLTQLIATLSALAGTVVYLWQPSWAATGPLFLSFESVVIAVAIALMGPGAISLDAYFFGRRRIVIPSVKRS